MSAPSVLVIGDFEHRIHQDILLGRIEQELGRKGARVSAVMPTDPAGAAQDKATSSDALVVLTLERNRSYSGLIKTRLDSLERAAVAGKPFGLVSYGDVKPAGAAVEHLRVVVAALQGFVIPSAVCASLSELAKSRVPRGGAAPPDPISTVVEELLLYARRRAGERALAAIAGEVNEEPHGFAVAQPVNGEISDDIALALAFIKENYADHSLRLDMVAGAVFVSRYHFSRKFRQQTGRRFMDYVAMLRMTEARRLLIQTNLAVTAIAQRVGYGDLANFDRSFKKLFNTRPTDYRMRYAERATDRVTKLGRLRPRGSDALG
jgi:AraC-like DNA-binding protein/NAD(P)H-dependent FMN reductase